MNKFIYVFNEDAKNVLISQNYNLLKEDTKNKIYVFENKPMENFSFSEISYILSDTLSF